MFTATVRVFAPVKPPCLVLLFFLFLEIGYATFTDSKDLFVKKTISPVNKKLCRKSMRHLADVTLIPSAIWPPIILFNAMGI